MSFLSRLTSHAWLAIPVVALGFLAWSQGVRADRVERVSALSGAVADVDPQSPSGYSGGVRLLLIPEQNHDSMQWIAQTQQMLARGEWRMRHVDYDNAPTGRAVRSPSAYRWWLGLVAWSQQFFLGAPPGIAVEQAALWADPALQMIMVVIGAIFVARCFGALPAALFSAGLVMLFPLAGSFMPGQPGDHGLVLACIVGSVLPLLAGAAGGKQPSSAGVRRSFLTAGIIGGFGIWIDVSSQFPVLMGILLGGLTAAWLSRTIPATTPSRGGETWPWRTWAAAGAVTSLALYAVEFFPSHLTLSAWHFDVGHPLYALAWLGAGELLARGTNWLNGEKPVWNGRTLCIVGSAAVAVFALPLAVVTSGGSGFLTPWSDASRLTMHTGGVAAANSLAWLSQAGFSASVWGTLLPLLILVPAGWLLLARRSAGAQAVAVVLALGPTIVALGFSCARLRWWAITDGCLLMLLMAVLTTRSQRRAAVNWLWSGAAAAVFLPGLIAGWPATEGPDAVTETEVRGMIERDIAHWLAARTRAEGAVVLAPPALTASFCYYGGLRGLGTPYRENEDGFRAAVRLAAASSADEGQALATNREVTHIVVPTWDKFLDEYARLGSNQPERTLIGLLHNWLPPRWLQAVPYQVPQIPGFPPHLAAVFEVGDTQDNASALGGLANYFLEMGRLDMATDVSHALAESFPADLGALIARAQTAQAGRRGPELTELMKSITAGLERKDERDLLWDQRVRLALLLAQAGRTDVARSHLQWCATELDEDRLRKLSTLTLYRLLTAFPAFNLQIPDARLAKIGRSLLPVELRGRL